MSRALWRAAFVAVVLVVLCMSGPDAEDGDRTARAVSEAVSKARPTRLDGLRVRAEHPRIWLDAERVSWLRAKVKGRTAAEVLELAGGSAPGMALASIASDDPAPCRAAWDRHVLHGRVDEGSSPLFHLALLYDWCHAHLAEGERARLRGMLVPPMEKDMANGRLWRSFHNAGHTSAFTLTASALALHGEHPVADKALAFLRPELEDILETFDRVFPDGEWAEGADYARHASHHGLRTFLALKSATGQDLLAGSPHLRNVANYIFYATKPNGLMFPGDDNDWPYLSGWEHVALLMVASEYRDPHAQWLLKHCPFPRFALPERDRWADLLWRDDAIAERSLDDLPLSRIFRGKGLVMARTAWGFDEAGRGGAWLAFTNGDYFGDHDHLDVNAFQIYRQGELAIDSGRYDDDWDFVHRPDKLLRSQFFNYYQRTIAHNTMLVRDPHEELGRGLLNDGGQRHFLFRGAHRDVPEDYAQGSFPSDEGVGKSDWATNPGRWERGDITAYTSSRDFVFVRGDGARAYAPKKVSAFVRELLFVRPRLVVVFDRVVATDASFEKTWLLHTVDEPRVAADGSWFEVTEGEGRLAGAVLLPEARRLRKVGGPGNEHLVAGVQLQAGPRSELNPSALHHGELPGSWRIEQQPSLAQAEDHFANVMLLTDRGSAERPQIEDVVDDAAGLAFRVRFVDAGSATTVSVRFAKGPSPATSLTIERGGRAVFDGALPDRVVLEEGRP